MQSALIQVDTQRIRRIPLSKFYAAGPFFVESEDYLVFWAFLIPMYLRVKFLASTLA